MNTKLSEDLIGKWARLENNWVRIYMVYVYEFKDKSTINSSSMHKWDLTDIRDSKPLTTEDIKGKWAKCIDSRGNNSTKVGRWELLNDLWYDDINEYISYGSNGYSVFPCRFDLTDLRDEKPLDVEARKISIGKQLDKIEAFDSWDYYKERIVRILAKHPAEPVIQFLKPENLK